MDELARLAFDVTACCICLDTKVIRREGEEPKAIVMDAVAGRRTWSPIANLPEIVGGLL